MSSISSPPTSASRLTRESYEPDNKVNAQAQQNQSASSAPITTTTNVSSPGRELPGAFPRELEAGSTAIASRSTGYGVSNELCVPIAGTVIHTAKSYMPNQVERVVERTGQTAAHYLPIPRGVQDTVSAYWTAGDTQKSGDASSSPQPPASMLAVPTNDASLPSSETRGTQPSQAQSGVGELPGKAGEAGVAVLPDERKEIQANGGATAKVLLRSQSNRKAVDEPRMQGNGTPPSLPSTESPDASDPTTFTTHTGGVGALPGGKDEVGVAVLPDQRQGNNVGNDGRGFRQHVHQQSRPQRELISGTKSLGTGVIQGTEAAVAELAGYAGFRATRDEIKQGSGLGKKENDTEARSAREKPTTDMQPPQDEDQDKAQDALAAGKTQQRAAEAGTVLAAGAAQVAGYAGFSGIKDEVREKAGLSASGKEEGGMEEKQKDEGTQKEPLPSRVSIEASRDPLKPSEPQKEPINRPSQPPQVQPPQIRAQPPQPLLKEIPPRVPGSQDYLKKAEPAAAIAFGGSGARGLALKDRSRESQGQGEPAKGEKPIKADRKDETTPNQGNLVTKEGVTSDYGNTGSKALTGVGAGGALFGAAALTEEEKKQRQTSHIQSEDADREKLGEYQRDRERMGREASGQEGILKASGMEEKVRDKEVGGETGVKEVKKAREEDKQLQENKEETKDSKAGVDVGAATGNGAVGGKDFAAQGSAIPGNGVAHDGDMPKKEPGDEFVEAHEHGQGRFLPGYQTNYHPSDLHPTSGDETKSADNDTALKSPGEGSHFAGDSEDGDIASHEGVRETADHGKGDTQEVAPADKRGKKVSFLKKVKGEAKIIAGKVSGKEGKVEAGKRVLHGEV